MAENSQADRAPDGSIGWGLFLLLASAVLLAEKLGWLPDGVDWV